MHPKSIAGLSPEELGAALAGLHYASLASVLSVLSQQLDADSRADKERGYTQLSSRLASASKSVGSALEAMRAAEAICAPHMKDEGEQPALSQDDANRLLAVLSTHFKQPVKPVEEYCAGIMDWFRVIVRNNRDQVLREHDRGMTQGSSYYQHLDRILVDMQKSNLLWRRIYLGEPLRTELCPMHHGHWEGSTAIAVGCPYGCQGTGWLPSADQIAAASWVSAQIHWTSPRTDGRIKDMLLVYTSRWSSGEEWQVQVRPTHHMFGATTAGIKFLDAEARKELLVQCAEADLLSNGEVVGCLRVGFGTPSKEWKTEPGTS
jgi:hypothetical protein